MEQKFLLDTNAIVDYFGGKLPASSMQRIKLILDESFNISVVAKIETLGFNGAAGDMQKLEELIRLADLLYIDDAVVQETINLRKSIPKLKLGDAIIAATALIHNLTLLTRNIDDFKNITALKVIDPHKL